MASTYFTRTFRIYPVEIELLTVLLVYPFLFLLLIFLGKRLSSYGGSLTFSIFYTTRDVKPIDAPDVIINTSNGYLVHSSIEQPPSVYYWTYSVKLSEDQFKNLDGSSLSREQFMNGLQNVVAIYIRAAYDSNAVTARLV